MDEFESLAFELDKLWADTPLPSLLPKDIAQKLREDGCPSMVQLKPKCGYQSLRPRELKAPPGIHPF